MREFYSRQSQLLQTKKDSKRLASQLQKTRLHTELSEADILVIRKAEFFFLATADEQGYPDCSIKGGNAGFVRIDNDKQLSILDYDGNGMFRSLGNIMANPNVGLLFLAFEGDIKKLRINCTAKIVTDDDQGASGEFRILFGVREIFPNCPRYLPEMRIEKSSVYNPSPGYDPPDPHWKSKDDLKDYLPHEK